MVFQHASSDDINQQIYFVWSCDLLTPIYHCSYLHLPLLVRWATWWWALTPLWRMGWPPQQVARRSTSLQLFKNKLESITFQLFLISCQIALITYRCFLPRRHVLQPLLARQPCKPLLSLCLPPYYTSKVEGQSSIAHAQLLNDAWLQLSTISTSDPLPLNFHCYRDVVNVHK